MIGTEQYTDKYIMERMEIMSKVAVVYWSGTANTAAMATAVAEGTQEQGGGGCVKPRGVGTDYGGGDVIR